MRVAVIGAGAFGTTMAWLLDRGGHEVSLWCYEREAAEAMRATGRNPLHMGDLDVSGVRVSADLAEALGGAEAAVLATPSFAAEGIARQAAGCGFGGPALLLTKGLAGDGRPLCHAVGDALGDRSRVAVLSGPNHAEEIARGTTSGAVVASESPGVARLFQREVGCRELRLYTSSDPVGAGVCGAAKNVVAVAYGMARGLGAGSNLLALLMTRGLAETSRLVVAMGGELTTCLGLAGVGDLDVTCHSRFSRNSMFGEAFALYGVGVGQFEASRGAVVEGVRAVGPLLANARRLGVEMPLAATVSDLVEGRVSLADAAERLAGRDMRPEF